jgi:RND family efflux transporter MFP subunit
MRKLVIAAAVLVAAALGVAWLAGAFGGGSGTPAGGGAAGGRPGGGGFGRPPMTVELAPVSRADLADRLMVVGNLIGAATVEVAPKTSGRLRTIEVRLGDPVSRGQVIARIEDSEIVEQVKQAEASHEVARATIRQREADLKFAETSLERSRNLYNRELLPRQTLDDNEARHQAALAQLDLARAQFAQTSSRLDELKIMRSNTIVVTPLEGFIGRRHLDPGAYVSSNTPVVSVVDIRQVRLVVNLVERDLRRVGAGARAAVEVDAYPGEQFAGRVGRIAPVLDPATRTAEMEVEIDNPRFRLKPGMYARVRLVTAERPNALVVPRNALVDVDGRRGVFVPVSREPAPAAAPAAGAPRGPGGGGGQVAVFREVQTGVQDGDQVEITAGLREGESIVTTGASAVRDGDPLVVTGGARGAPGGPDGQGRPAAAATPPGRAPATP